MEVKVQFPSLLNDLKEVSETYSQRTLISKALNTYSRCKRAGKINLSEKIMVKYGLDRLSPLRDDSVIAFAMTLNANK